MLDKPAYKIDELAKRGPFCRTLLFRAIRDGKLRAKKFGRSTIVLHDDFMSFLQALPERPLAEDARG